MKNLSGLTSIFLCSLMIAFSPIVGKISVGVVLPALLVLLSAIIATAFFMPWVIKNNQLKVLFARKTLLQFFTIGTFGTALMFTVLLIALKYTTPANAAVLQQSEMVYSLIFAYFLFKEKPTVKQLAGTALIILGVTVLLINGRFSLNLKGDLLIIGSTWMLQLSASVAKRLPKELDYKLISTARNVFAIPVMIVVVLVHWRSGGSLFLTPNIKFWGVLAYTGIFKYALAMIFWYIALRKLDLAKMTALYLSYPVLTFAFSVLLGFDKIEIHKVIGLALTMIGVYLMTITVNAKTNKLRIKN